VQLPDSNYLYEGPCINGRKNGKGKITRLGWSRQYSYEGEFINGSETLRSKASWVTAAIRARDLRGLVGNSVRRLFKKARRLLRNTARLRRVRKYLGLAQATEEISRHGNVVETEEKDTMIFNSNR
ncbi:MAG: hypothetical protein LBB24_00310, partial [Rickettsiales bacterium]|nr:hypothetical protein [Rickettsiales bacterium]